MVYETNRSSQKRTKAACGILYMSLPASVSSERIKVLLHGSVSLLWPKISDTRKHTPELPRNRKKKESDYQAIKSGERTRHNYWDAGDLQSLFDFTGLNDVLW